MAALFLLLAIVGGVVVGDLMLENTVARTLRNAARTPGGSTLQGMTRCDCPGAVMSSGV